MSKKLLKKSAPDHELGIVGALLHQPKEMMGVLLGWGCDDSWFEYDVAGKVFKVATALHMEGNPIDPITVCGRLETAYGNSYQSFLESAVERSLPAHGGYYAECLRERWYSRKTLDSVVQAEDKLLGVGGAWDTDAVINTLLSDVSTLGDFVRGTSRPTPSQVRASIVDKWEAAARGEADARGLPWPMESMNVLTCGIYPGLNVIAARPSVGKTTFEGMVSRYLYSLGKRGVRVCLDMTEEMLLSRDICAIAGESMNKFRSGYMTPSDATKVRAVEKMMECWDEVVVLERSSEGIVAQLRALAAKKPLDFVTLDYVQLVDVGSRDNDNARISKVCAQLKTFSVNTGVPIILLSQLSREVEKDNRTPQLSDLRDSGAIEQDASTVVFLYIEPTIGKAWANRCGLKEAKELPIRPVMWDLLKNQQGRVGRIALRMHAKYFLFEEAAAEKDIAGDEQDCKWGYNFSEPARPTAADPNLNVYCVVKHPKGAIEVLSKVYFEKINAVMDEKDRYTLLEEAVGITDAVQMMEEIRKGTFSVGRGDIDSPDFKEPF